MTAAAAVPGHLPAPGTEDRWLAENPWWTDAPEPPAAWLAEDPGLAEDPWWTEEPEPPATRPAEHASLAEDPGLADGGEPAQAWPTEDPWLAEDPWLDEDPEWAEGPWLDEDPWLAEDQASSQRPGPVEVFKAGRWDRSRGDGGGFAAGGAADDLPPGPVLAGLAGDRWADGLGRLSDDELIGVLRAARRLTSWAAAMELAVAGDLWRRRLAGEEAGDTGAAEFAGDEVAAALTLTKHAADQVLSLAVALGRLPRTGAALAAGDIDLPRAKVIADETTGLTSAHAAAVEDAVIGAAAKQTTGQLRAATHRAVLAADPAAERKRKEEALRAARVEHWTEPAGTAALAGRDLPPAAVLAADANLTALAKQLKAAGVPGTMDALRAEIYLALLTGIAVTDLLPAVASRIGAARPGSRDPGGGASAGSGGGSADGGSGASRSADDGSADGGSGASSSGASDSGAGGSAGCGSGASGSGDRGCGVDGSDGPGGLAGPCTAPPTSSSGGAPLDLRRPGASAGGFPAFTGLVAGSVNLTIPLATWLGLADTPGHAAGFGPLDATDSRALADALAARAETKWCLTVIGPDGYPVAHGCARAGPSPGRRRKRRTTATGDRPAAGSRDGPESRARDRTWTVTITPLDDGACDHAWETPAYEPTPGLRHLVRIRHVTCTFPGCRRPAAQCDADHTLAYDRGGRTCLCNLAPLCRHHHQVKQARGWALQQASPGVLTWTTPAGRRYTTTPTSYTA